MGFFKIQFSPIELKEIAQNHVEISAFDTPNVAKVVKRGFNYD